PPRIIANDSALLKKLAPGAAVTVSFPALIKSGSTSSSVGYGPIPNKPFSDCMTIVLLSEIWFAKIGRASCRERVKISVDDGHQENRRGIDHIMRTGLV